MGETASPAAGDPKGAFGFVLERAAARGLWAARCAGLAVASPAVQKAFKSLLAVGGMEGNTREGEIALSHGSLRDFIQT